MDVTPFLDLQPAPRVLFNQLPERGSQARFLLPSAGGWLPVTWQQLADQVRHASLHLQEVGLQPVERAAIFAGNSVQWLAAALGIQAARGVMVPVYPSCTAEQAAYVLEHGDCQVVYTAGAALLERVLTGTAWAVLRKVVLLADLNVAALVATLEAKGIVVPGDWSTKVQTWSQSQDQGQAVQALDPQKFDRVLGQIRLSDVGLMLYTSGTSGQPKGVPLTHENVGVNGRDWLICNGPLLDPGMVDLLWLPMSHIYGFGEACLGNTLGFTTYLSDPLQVMNHLSEVKPSVFMSVPSVWEKFAVAAQAVPLADQKAELDRVTGGRMKFCLSGGAGLKREVKEFLFAHGMLIMEGYGLTECSPTLTLNRPDSFRFDSVGKPVPSVTLQLAEDGEILAKGANIFAGYHKDPKATAEIFTADGWLCTGDIGRWTEDGFLQIIDRKKDILVTAGGKNVPPANIEMQFHDDPVIAHVVVYGDGRRYLTAGIWAWDAVAARMTQEQLHEVIEQSVQAVNARLAHHETIKKWRLMTPALTVEGGLLTPTLKVKRKLVCTAFQAQFESMY